MRSSGGVIGTVLGGKYRIERALGEGGMGAVYAGVQEPLQRRVAIKVLHPALAKDATLVARFRREAEVAAGLGHSNIVQVTDFGVHEGRAFLVMDLLQGEPLADAMERGPFEESRLKFIVSQVLSALEAAHAKDIVHRDLKPDNIYLTNMSGVADIVKLLDFGIARLVDGGDAKMTTTGQILGTPAYMSPEQARGKPVDARTDLYSLGVVMYEALSGHMPINGSNYHELMFAIVGEKPTPLAEHCPHLSPSLVELVERAMAKDRDARFQSAAEMRAAIEALGPLEVSRPAAVASVPPTRPSATVPKSTPEAFAATMATPAAIRPQTPVATTAGAPKRSGVLLALGLLGAALAGGVGVYALTSGGGDEEAPAPIVTAGPPSETGESAMAEAERAVAEANESAMTETADTESAMTESTMTESATTESAMTESAMTESAMAEVATAETAMSAMTGAPDPVPAPMTAMRRARPHRQMIACGDRGYEHEMFTVRRRDQVVSRSLRGNHVVALDDLRPFVRSLSDEFTQCYRGHLIMRGQNFILDIGADGTVTGARARVYCPVDSAVASCMRRVFVGKQLPPDQNAPGEVWVGLDLVGH
ncbi:MAG: protein kinase [Myxococcota bacterium]